MAKRFLALLLTAAMLLTGLTLSASAAAATETIDGEKYTVVSNEAELAEALGKGGNIMLKNDIEIGSKFNKTVEIAEGTVLDGNGYALLASSVLKSSILTPKGGVKVGGGQVKIRNISFGTKTAPLTVHGPNALFYPGSAATATFFHNVNFYVVRTGVSANSGALYNSTNSNLDFNGCYLDVTMTDVTGGTLHGGWFGTITSQVVMTDCVTAGTISAPFGVGAFAGQNSTGNLDLVNCTNLANVTGKGYVGGFIGNIGTGANSQYLTGCVNYGAITSTGTDYNAIAGGFVGRQSNQKSEERLRVFYDCINYGTIKSGNVAGGIVGRTHDNDPVPRVDFVGCLNVGDVEGSQYAGGIIGIASPLVMSANIEDCANIGKIKASLGAGNFGGLLCKTTVTNSFAAGITTGKAGTLAGLISGDYKVPVGASAGQNKTITAPTATDVRYYGAMNPAGEGVTKVAEGDLATMLADMEALFGKTFVKADAADAENKLLVLAAPELRGVQLKQNANGTITVRLASTVDAIDAYRSFRYLVKVTTEKGTYTKRYGTYELYKSLNQKNGTVTAASMGAEYIFTAEVLKLPSTGRVMLEITPYAYSTDASRAYYGATRVLTLENGRIGEEAMKLNGVLLQEYSIVVPYNGTKTEKLLADRLASKLTKLTGVVIPVFTEKQTNTRDYTIAVGVSKNYPAPENVSGRKIVRLGADTASIQILGDTTAQLSEAVQYFIDTIEAKITASQNEWTIADTIDVPVDTKVSIMAYNMGAKDNAQIKKAEWNLIVDYLPDILTSQEPWAGFLDDFLNAYAVQPSPGFASASNDNIMATDVNNKAFTGKGYYGVYWGLPRWVPGDANNNGKASYSVILYAKDRFDVDLNKSGTFWLSTTPNTSGSVTSGSNFARCATYATLTDKNTGEQFVVVNVHLDFVEDVKVKQVQYLLKGLKSRVGTDLPIFITGDMNAEYGDAAITEYFNNSTMRMSALDYLAKRTYRDERNIDWLFTNKPSRLEVIKYKYCGETPFLNALWNEQMIMGKPSDHPAVYAEFRFKK